MLYHSMFFIYSLEGSYALGSRLKVIGLEYFVINKLFQIQSNVLDKLVSRGSKTSGVSIFQPSKRNCWTLKPVLKSQWNFTCSQFPSDPWNYKVLTVLQLFSWFLDSFLKTGVMSAHLKRDGNGEEHTESLNWIQINSAK